MEATVAARTLDEWLRASAGRARVAGEIDIAHACFTRDGVAPITTQDLGDPGKLVLLDQEVRLGPSTFASAGRTAYERRDSQGEAALA